MSVTRQLDSPHGWHVVPVHYTNDPEKDHVWESEQRKSYARVEDWNREMEIDFSQVSGVRAYPNFRVEAHASTPLIYNRMLPLCLCVDFNVGIMTWPIVQIVQGAPQIIDEVSKDPADVPLMVDEFRSKYPNHPGELWVYGDAAGNAQSAHDRQSDYDLMRWGFRGYAAPIVWKVPRSNPPVRERINAVNGIIKTIDGAYLLRVDPRCERSIADFLQVLLDKDGKILKTTDRKLAYSMLTHASDAFGYMAAREFPVVDLVEASTQKKKYRPLKYGTLLGDQD